MELDRGGTNHGIILSWPVFAAITFVVLLAIVGSYLVGVAQYRPPKGREHALSAQYRLWTLRGILNEVEVEAAEEIDVILIPDREEHTWTWIVRNKSEVIYQLEVADKAIPERGLPERRDKVYQGSLLAGPCVIQIRGGTGITQTAVEMATDTGRADSYTWGDSMYRPGAEIREATGAKGREVFTAGDVIELLRVGADDPNAEVGDGLLVWLKPTGRRQPDTLGWRH